MNTLLIAVSTMTIFAFIFGSVLGFANTYFEPKDDLMVEKINNILPQIQCGQCGYPGCYSYAVAIINNNETINKCTPGGEKTMLTIAELLNVEQQITDKDSFLLEDKTAFIDESNCIGCNKCTQICPVDAIIGARHTLHTVIQDLCIGCNLCIYPCPTDCISMLPTKK